ncbi:Putative FAS1 domain-containing protein [Septoria linicola]|uniref:FAS1 domain-containing protein n=1 Tax=Septoria linicola TaxID=215465 RepID=A0A9Q9ELD2_9PEZI|nr:Putative FAS1 domain-containing protein [Septoria linicola]
MRTQAILVISIAVFAASQSTGSEQSGSEPLSLEQVLTNTPQLSSLLQLFDRYPALLSSLNNTSNITVFAPINNALQSLIDDAAITNRIAEPGFVEAVTRYHITKGAYFSSSFTLAPQFALTMMGDEKYSSLVGGQRLILEQFSTRRGSLLVQGGSNEGHDIVQADTALAGGSVLHHIDGVLTLPANVSATAVQYNLTSLVDALVSAGLSETVDRSSKVTIFAPLNPAFSDVASVLRNLTAEDRAHIMRYHVVNGTVAYSTELNAGRQLQSSSGQILNITRSPNDRIFINSARVISSDVLLSGGVLHIVDTVLNPNATLLPNYKESKSVPAFTAVPDANVVANPDFSGAGLSTGAKAGIGVGSHCSHRDCSGVDASPA